MALKSHLICATLFFLFNKIVLHIPKDPKGLWNTERLSVYVDHMIFYV